jgi:hypothetical protein
VFVEGDPEKVKRVRELFPDATYSQWSRIRGALRDALKHALEDPAVPGAMDSYSGAKLPGKLGIRSGSTVALIDAPKDFRRTLGILPDGVKVRRQARGQAHVVVLFVKSRVELERRLLCAERTLAQGGRLWIAWPKKTSGISSDLTQAVVRRVGLDSGLVDYKICAVDETWSGLCFARRRRRKK